MATQSNRWRGRFFSLLVICALAPHCSAPQSSVPSHGDPHQARTGSRIVALEGFGDYFVSDAHGQTQLIRPEGLGVNIVAEVQRVEGDRLWIRSNGAGDEAVGWINKKNAILLEDAIAYFTSLIGDDPQSWDAYLRRGEAEHALNQREAAIADYTRAIELHPSEPFLYLRRGRSFRTMKACTQAIADFEQAINLRPDWAEPYNLAAGVHAGCPDPQHRDPQKAIELAQQAIALDAEQHPTYLTVLALSYFRAGDLDNAVLAQRQALDSPRFPPGYREDATNQLRKYERAVTAQEPVR